MEAGQQARLHCIWLMNLGDTTPDPVVAPKPLPLERLATQRLPDRGFLYVMRRSSTPQTPSGV